MAKSLATREDGINAVSLIAKVVMPLQYTVVKFDSQDTVDLAVANTDYGFGVIQRTQEVIGGDIAVKCSGFSLIAIAGTVTAGQYLTPAALGKAVATSTAGHIVFAQALEAGANGDYIQCKLITPVKYSSIA